MSILAAGLVASAFVGGSDDEDHASKGAGNDLIAVSRPDGAGWQAVTVTDFDPAHDRIEIDNSVLDGDFAIRVHPSSVLHVIDGPDGAELHPSTSYAEFPNQPPEQALIGVLSGVKAADLTAGDFRFTGATQAGEPIPTQVVIGG